MVATQAATGEVDDIGIGTAHADDRGVPGQAPQVGTEGIVSVEHGRIALVLVLEDPQLDARVLLQRAVPIEMIRRDVDQRGGVAVEAADVLELEAGQLADDDGALGEVRSDLAERDADVATDPVRQAVGTQHRANQLGRRRLPVGARHADDARARRQQAVAQLDLGPDWNAALMRCLQHGMTAGHAGAPDDRLTPLVVDGVRGDDRHRRLASPLRRVVDERHLATGLEQCGGGGEPRASRSEHDRQPWQIELGAHAYWLKRT